MRIACFAHDLSNPAVAQRVKMLQAGGAEVALLGFNRGRERMHSVAGVAATNLGRTRDARLFSRAGSVLLALAAAPLWSRKVAGAETILARNLEMLVLAQAARMLAAPKAAVVYEVLDVHRLMLGVGTVSRALRWIERRLMRRASALVVSSSAFVASYFEPYDRPRLPVVLVENKVLALDEPPSRSADRAPGPPWRIAWCGMLRCQRSLDILAGVARRAPGLIEVEIHGRPAYTAFRDFDAQVATSPGVTYHGPYVPSALPAIYASAHFVWAIDYFEAGQNSDWLLPNRLYEGQLNGAVAIALRGVETGRWLARRGVGLLLDDAETELAAAMATLAPEAYGRLARQTTNLPMPDLAYDRDSCLEVVRTLEALVPT